MICDIVAGIPRAFPEGTDISKLTQTVRNDFIERGAFPKGVLDTLAEVPAEAKPAPAPKPDVKAEPVSESKDSFNDDDLPFTMGDEKPEAPYNVFSPSKSDVEIYADWKSRLSQNRDSNGLRRSYPEEAIRLAENTYGKQLGSIQESAKRLTDCKTYYETFRGKSDDKTSAIVRFKGCVDDVAHGIGDMKTLCEAYSLLNGDRVAADFYDERAAKALSEAQNSYLAARMSGNPYNVNRFRWDAEHAMGVLAKSFERGAKAQFDKNAFGKAANKNVKPVVSKGANGKNKLSLRRIFKWYERLQQYSPDVFRAVDGWKNEGGIGYQLADEAERSFVRRTEEYAKGEDFFVGLDKVEGFDEFARGKTAVEFEFGREKYTISELEAITLIKNIDTINASGGVERAKKLKGISISGEKYDINGAKLLELRSGLASQLTPAGEAYMKSLMDMLEYYSTPLRETRQSVYGGDVGMYKRGEYMPLRYANSSSSNIDSSPFDYESIRVMQDREYSHGGYLLIEPVTKVSDWYMRNASDYIAYSGFSERLKALDRSTYYFPGLSDTMEQFYGTDGKLWTRRYIDRICKARRPEQTTGEIMLRTLRTNLYKGAIPVSISSPMKQWAGYWSAADVVGFGNLFWSYRLKPFVPAKGHSLQNPVMRNRRREGINQTYADIMDANETRVGRLKTKSSAAKWLLDGVSRNDLKVFDNIYTACERAVKNKNPGIDVSSAEYRKLVDDMFNLAAMRTQSIFAPTLSAELQRSDNEWLKLASVFRSQQAQDFSRIVRAVNEYKAATGEDAKSASSSTLRSSVTGAVVSSLSLGLMTVGAQLILHRHRRFEDEEGKLSPELIAKRFVFESMKNAAGIAWFGDELASAVLSIATRGDEKYYGYSLAGIDSFSDIASQLTNFSKNPSVYNAKVFVNTAFTSFGIPVNNAYNMLNSAIMFTLDLTGENGERYDDILKWMHNELGGNVSDFEVKDEKVELSFSERHRYKKIFDESERRFSADYAGLPSFKELDDKQIERVFKALRGYSNYKAKQSILNERGEERFLNREGWYDLPERSMVQYLSVREQARALYDDDGNIKNYAAMDRWLMSGYSSLNSEQKELLNKSGMSRLDDMYRALYQGIGSEKYDAAYKLYKKYDEAPGSGTARAEDLKVAINGLGLKKEQAAWLCNELKLWQHSPIDTVSYDKLVEAGLSYAKADKLRDDMRELPLLDGKSGVTNNQKYAAIMNAKYLSDEQKWAAFFAIATDAAAREAENNRALGLSYDQWLSTSKKYGVIK